MLASLILAMAVITSTPIEGFPAQDPTSNDEQPTEMHDIHQDEHSASMMGAVSGGDANDNQVISSVTRKSINIKD